MVSAVAFEVVHVSVGTILGAAVVAAYVVGETVSVQNGAPGGGDVIVTVVVHGALVPPGPVAVPV
jgi:hypothetical protein